MATAPAISTILHVIDSVEPGGAETVFIQLAEELRERGYKSITVVSGPGWVTTELQQRNFNPVIINAKGSFNWRFVRALLKIIREEKVDVIQSHLLGSNVYCALAGLIARKRVIATFHGMVDVSPNERMRWLKFHIMNLGISQFVAVSRRLGEAIHKEGLLNPKKTTVIYNGIKFSRYGRSECGDLRASLGLDRHAILIGSLGNLHPAKGYDYLIRASSKVIKQNPNAHFVIGGDLKPHLYKDLKAQVNESGVADHIHFIGFVTDSAAFLSQLDLFLLPSVSEGFSIATIEAMATGLPCILTRSGGPEEIADDGTTALMITPADPDAIATTLMKLLAAPELQFGLGIAARNAMLTRFSIDTMVSHYLDLYKSST